MSGRVARAATCVRIARFAFCWVLVFVSALRGTVLAAPDQRHESGPRVVAGRVLDQTGGAIRGAAVSLKVATGERRTTTDNDGQFAFEAVTGDAILVVTFAGFAPATLDVGRDARGLRVVLDPVPVTEAVTVHGLAARERRITSATRTDTPLRDVPQSITVVSRDLIADQTMRSIAEVVNYVPGVGMAQGEGHRDAPIFRGNTSTSDFYVDGLRDDTQYLRDLYNVDRVEVLKGPNGMIFGRGGAGGVINRVTRHADWTSPRELSVQGGSWGLRRLTGDVGGALNNRAAARVTGVFENSDTYRTVDIERYGVNPTIALSFGRSTTWRAGYEFFHDNRTTDRGVPSYQGRPLDTDPSAFFGHTRLNTSRVTMNALSSVLEHTTRGGLTIRNTTRFADYDKFYGNLVPGAVNAARTTVSLTGYNSGTQRQNLFNQTDIVLKHRTGRLEHTMLAGSEFGRQVTDNRRLTAFFPSVGPTTTSISVPLSNPTTSLPLEFRAAGSDADNHGTANVMAVYAQDQVTFSPRVQAVVGVRYDKFDVKLRDHRTGSTFGSNDGLLSPRLALVFKPVTAVSVYGSYTLSHLPRAGEQLASLTLSNQALEPENFRNYEFGARWELRPALTFSSAVYRLDHGNVAVRDAVDPTVSHLVDAERVLGLELELSGRLSDRWTTQGGYAYQDGEITRSLSATVLAGARLAQVPRHSFSLWNKYEVTRLLGVGLGVISRSDSFVATDNAVILPGFTRVDAGVFLTVNDHVRAHANVENLLNTRYFWSAHNNNNIAPGSPRAVRIALTTRF